MDAAGDLQYGSLVPPDSPIASVSVHALSAGYFTIPEYQFVHPVARDARRTVPSLAFLIEHCNPNIGKITRILFDLGLRRDIKRYPAPIQEHIETRRPITTTPDVTASLAMRGLTPADIDFVIFSHLHWDHIGEPLDFPTSTFILGPGSNTLLQATHPHSQPHSPHSFIEPNLLPTHRTIELSPPSSSPLAPTIPAPPPLPTPGLTIPTHPSTSPTPSTSSPTHPASLSPPLATSPATSTSSRGAPHRFHRSTSQATLSTTAAC